MYSAVISKKADSDITNILTYLLRFWGTKVHNEFIDKLNETVSIIELTTFTFPEVENYKGVRRIKITKHNALYYKINDDNSLIEIITVYDTRKKIRHPEI
jgi:plasmid stabilization system protein ParE